MGLTSLEARCSKVTAGSQLGIAPPFDLSEGGRIIRGLDRRSTCGTPFLPKLRPPGRRALFSVATRLHRCRLWDSGNANDATALPLLQRPDIADDAENNYGNNNLLPAGHRSGDHWYL